MYCSIHFWKSNFFNLNLGTPRLRPKKEMNYQKIYEVWDCQQDLKKSCKDKNYPNFFSKNLFKEASKAHQVDTEIQQPTESRSPVFEFSRQNSVLTSPTTTITKPKKRFPDKATILKAKKQNDSETKMCEETCL